MSIHRSAPLFIYKYQQGTKITSDRTSRNQIQLVFPQVQSQLCYSDQSANVSSYRSESVVLRWPAASQIFGSFSGLRGIDKGVDGGNHNGDPLQWHEWFGQFKSAIYSQSLADNVKLTYLETLVTGKAKTAIAEFAYCELMYKDTLKTIERKYGQPQAVSAHLGKLSSFPSLKRHNFDNIINYLQKFQVLLGSLNHFHMTRTLRAHRSLKQ